MNTKISLVCGLLAMVVALGALSLSDSATAAPKPAAKAAEGTPKQLLVTVWVNGASFGMRRQELPISKEDADGSALPALQKAGWRIVSVNMTGTAGVNPKQQAGLVLLEK